MVRNNRALHHTSHQHSSLPLKRGTHLAERVNCFQFFRRRDGVPEVDFDVVWDSQFLLQGLAIARVVRQEGEGVLQGPRLISGRTSLAGGCCLYVGRRSWLTDSLGSGVVQVVDNDLGFLLGGRHVGCWSLKTQGERAEEACEGV